MSHSLARRVSGTTPYYNLIRRVAFPSVRAMLVSMVTLTSLGVGVCFLIVGRTGYSFVSGVTWGLVFLACPALISNTLLYWIIMNEDPLFYFRRCLAFSLFSINTWLIFLFMGSILSRTMNSFIFPEFSVMMGLFAVIPLRALAVFSMSRTSFSKRLLFTLIEPASSMFIGVLVLGLPAVKSATALMLAALAGLTFAFSVIILVEHYGRRSIGFSPIRMFRAFLTDWLEADNQNLEAYLDELGVETELDVATFVFRRQKTSVIKTLLLVSNFHPGPFLNVGSSDLPYLFQALARKRLKAIALVPHGISGHELNLVSQVENEKIIRWVFNNLNTTKFTSVTTPVVRSRNDLATATSQIFDDCALVTMTTSPSDMEDVPTDLANRIAGLTKGKFRHVALIDAHNCLTGPTTMSQEKVGALEEAALESLQRQRSSVTFKIGAAHRDSSFKLREGFGPGGISVMAVETNGEAFAYISIDGNNMVKDLREQILAEIRTLGFADGEVLTSDTHMVNGIVSARLGYYPIGAAVPRSILLQEIKSACKEALADLEVCEVGVLTKQLELTTLGTKSLRRVMNVVYRISKLTAIIVFPIIVVIAVLSILLLM